jgi:hypothetical protein
MPPFSFLYGKSMRRFARKYTEKNRKNPQKTA